MRQQLRVWDAPLRIFHWLLALSVVFALFTGWQGGSSWMGWHERAGLFIVGLLSFRIVWLLLGSTYARLSTLLCSLLALPKYLRGEWRQLGHNPLGVLSVFAMLGMLSWQAVSGLFANDGSIYTGPLYSLVSRSLSADITRLHKLGLWIIIGLITVHILGYPCSIKKHISETYADGKNQQEHQKKSPGGHWLFCVCCSVWWGHISTGVAITAPGPQHASRHRT